MQRGVQAGDVAHEIIKAVSGDAARRVHVHAVEALHDLGVIGDLKIGHRRLTEALNLHVCGIVRADGDGGVDDVRDVQHEMPDLLGVFPFQTLQLREALVIGLDFRHIRVDLGLDRGLFLIGGLFQFSEQGAVRFRELVFLCAQVAGLGNGGTVETVKLNDLVHHGQLLILEFLFDVFLDDLRIFPDKLDVEHSILTFLL